ncbi:MAG TPA: FosX/FosE/FosI family fosfomycin resistance hydrolase [Spirochaetota bacterium]|nr:FosX/FosE/FosI family fosfomycin resistance hydrolase [Spirochaetota bacterium]HPI22616.1 FosX/FosE/FosI family fosfomycin resistance hydrolase [Spirochaetota bacterium]
MVRGISHITLIVRDLEKSSAMLATVLDAEEIYSSGDRTFSHSRERFFLVGSVWIALMEGPALTARTYNHIAFHIDDAEFATYRERVTKLGLDIDNDRSRIAGEGRSLYFYDYDNHLFELHTGTLEERLRAYTDQ